MLVLRTLELRFRVRSSTALPITTNTVKTKISKRENDNDDTDGILKWTKTINDAGLNLIKQFASLRLTAYQDSVGVWTIGYAHTKGVKPGQTITREQAEEFLQEDVGTAEAAVNRLGLPVNGNQFSALVSFTLNEGEQRLKHLISHGMKQIPTVMLSYVYAGHKRSPRLARRRRAEQALFLKAD